MKGAIIALSRNGIALAEKLFGLYPEIPVYVPSRFFGDFIDKAFLFESKVAKSKVYAFNDTLAKTVSGIFDEKDLIIFISAAAVAVRTIAPCIKNKASDPAIIVIDEQGRFVISLLSGHLGGANEESARIAEYLCARPVITTATDGRGMTAFDGISRKLGWKIENLPDMKLVSAAILEGREIFFYSDCPFDEPLHGPIRVVDDPDLLQQAEHGAVIVSSRLVIPLPGSSCPRVIMRPSMIAAGVGCRRGIQKKEIQESIISAFRETGLSIKSLSCLATGEFKANEEGLISAASAFGVPLKIYNRQEILSAMCDSISSDFVRRQVGVGAVAEPCARLGSEGGRIVLPTRRHKGVTVALASKCC